MLFVLKRHRVSDCERFCVQVFHCLNEILELCHNFCSLVSQTVTSLDERGAAQLDLLVKVTPLVCLMLGDVKFRLVTRPRFNPRASGVSRPCCLKSFPA